MTYPIQYRPLLAGALAFGLAMATTVQAGQGHDAGHGHSSESGADGGQVAAAKNAPSPFALANTGDKTGDKARKKASDKATSSAVTVIDPGAMESNCIESGPKGANGSGDSCVRKQGPAVTAKRLPAAGAAVTAVPSPPPDTQRLASHHHDEMSNDSVLYGFDEPTVSAGHQAYGSGQYAFLHNGYGAYGHNGAGYGGSGYGGGHGGYSVYPGYGYGGHGGGYSGYGNGHGGYGGGSHGGYGGYPGYGSGGHGGGRSGYNGGHGGYGYGY